MVLSEKHKSTPIDNIWYKKGNKSATGIKRYGYLTSKTSYYLTGFTTTIRKATEKDLSLLEDYGLELVSAYAEIDPSLIFMVEKKRQSTLSTQMVILEVRVGVMIIGELRIMIQVLPKEHYNLTYNYFYRTDTQGYAKASGYRRANSKKNGVSKQEARHNYNQFKKNKR